MTLCLLGHHDLAVAVDGGGEVALVVVLHVEHEGGRRVRPHSGGVPHDEPDAEDQTDDQDHEPQDETIAQGDVGEPGRDAGRERVDRRAEDADAAAEEDDQGADERVVARRDHDGDDQHVEGEALLGHAEGGPADREHRHEDRDHQAFPALQAPHQPGDASLDRPGLHRDADEPADHEDEQGDVDGTEELAAVEDVDVAGGSVLDAVEAVDRGLERVDCTILAGLASTSS